MALDDNNRFFFSSSAPEAKWALRMNKSNNAEIEKANRNTFVVFMSDFQKDR